MTLTILSVENAQMGDYVQKANDPIEQGERCAYEDIHLRQ